jgi:DNA-binding HxlR family transcriptional regulator
MARNKGYGQFCPISRASEILAERWTPLVVRELLCGSVRFNDLQRGVPRMSSALLSRRLKELEYAGIVERRPVRSGRGWEYHLTDAGRELLPVLHDMGKWAQRWVRHDLTAEENLDPDLLMWDIRRSVTSEGMPTDRRFTVRFQYADVPANRRRYWLVFEREGTDLCIKDPGFEVDLYVSSTLRTMVQIWLGHESINEALREGRLVLDGAPKDIKAFHTWFSLSVFAAAGREPPGAIAAPRS